MATKPKITETQIKRQIKDYLKIKGYFWYWLVQGLGSFRGLPDLVVHDKVVVYLEVKTEKGKLSVYQQAFKKECEESNIEYYVVRSVEDVMEIL